MPGPDLNERKNNLLKYEIAIFLWCFASFSMGIIALEASLILLMLFRLLLALVYGQRVEALFGKGRRAALFFFGALILSAAISQFRTPLQQSTTIHWAFVAFWATSPSLLRRLDWAFLHRLLLIVSIPGMIFSIYWLLQPDEIAWALQKGFQMYPRAEGFVSNPITNAEGLVIIACWSLARLNQELTAKERNWIWTHLILSLLIVVFSRVRAGLMGFTFILLVNVLISYKNRKTLLLVWLAMAGTFFGTIYIFGFNSASIYKRLDLLQSNLRLFAAHPIFGVGPNWLRDQNLENSPQMHPHNTLVGIATESGLVGLTTYLVLMGVLVWQLMGLRKRHHSPDDPLTWVVRALSGAFICYWIFGLFDYNFADTELLIFHSLQWSMVVSLTLLNRESRPVEPST